MVRVRTGIVVGALACCAFVVAFAARRGAAEPTATFTRRPASDAPDSVKLAAMGIHPGKQLLAYVFLASRCGHCQQPETKQAVRTLRRRLKMAAESTFAATTVVGVAVEGLIPEGVSYLTNIGLTAFDEISIGNAWLNEQISRFTWREHVMEPAVPQVVLVSRSLDAAAAPFNVTLGSDSVLAVLTGRKAVTDWIERGASVGLAIEIARQSQADTGITRVRTQSRR